MIQASEDKKNRLIGFAMLTNLGVGCISRAVSVEGKKILRFEGRTNKQTDKQTDRQTDTATRNNMGPDHEIRNHNKATQYCHS